MMSLILEKDGELVRKVLAKGSKKGACEENAALRTRIANMEV
jgi:hypothetical protein